MNTHSPKSSCIVLTLLASLLIASCGPARLIPAPTQGAAPILAPTNTLVPLQPTQESSPTQAPAATATTVATATSVATATPIATATLVATTTPVAPSTSAAAETPTPPAAVPAEGLSAWCLPENTALSYASDPANPPAFAKIGKYVKEALEVPNLPSSGCVFIYTFNQPAAEGLKLEVYEANQKTPWLTADLKPVEGQPNSVSALLRHTYIVAPPVWNISYTFALRGASGQELRRDKVNLHRWVPKLCWNGQRPNVNTLRCPLPQDLHPWDPSYGTPIPTFPPDGD